MARRIIIEPAAARDFLQQAAYLAVHASPAVARRFDRAVTGTLTRLAGMPNIGSPYEVVNPRLDGLRVWAVRRFENYLIFYLVRDDAIQVVRCLHGARDIEGQLERF